MQKAPMPPKAVRAFEKGTTLFLKGQAQESLQHFQKAIDLAPNAYAPYHNLALAYQRLGRLDDAAKSLEKSIELSNWSVPQSLLSLAMISYMRRDFKQTEILAEKAVSLVPGSALGRYCLGLAQFSLGRPADAQRSALEALRLDPLLVDAHLLLAHVHERLGNPSAVTADAQAYLAASPSGDLRFDAEALLQRAHEHENLGSASLR